MYHQHSTLAHNNRIVRIHRFARIIVFTITKIGLLDASITSSTIVFLSIAVIYSIFDSFYIQSLSTTLSSILSVITTTSFFKPMGHLIRSSYQSKNTGYHLVRVDIIY